jgi:lysyl endopeptidase
VLFKPLLATFILFAMYNRLLSAFILIFASIAVTNAQISRQISPKSQKTPFPQAAPIVLLKPLNIPALIAEDLAQPGQNRFSAPIFTEISTLNQGQWTEFPDGSRVWRCGVQAQGAEALILVFEKVNLPEGATLHAYSPDKKQVLGAYTKASCLPNGRFLIGPVTGETVILEIMEPAEAKNMSKLVLNRVDYAYKKDYGGEAFSFGTSAPCNININCTAGSNWQIEKKGIARILMVFQNGTGWCTGSLMANTANSFEPYLLTAHHCQLIGQTPDFPVWRFDFDYEAANCPNPAIEPIANSVLGCTRVSFRSATDFMLLKLNPIPGNFDVYFNGWNRDTVTTYPTSTFIHHPDGDIKKISIDNDPLKVHPNVLNWGGPFGSSQPNTHWKVIPDVGVFQGGSSGGPLFDTQKRILGQLHGGVFNACTPATAYFGRFNQSWSDGQSPEERLKDWLDPANTGVVTKNGYPRPISTGYDLSGHVKSHLNVPMMNVKMEISGGTNMVVYTNSLGNFTFPNVPSGGTYTVTASRDTNLLNGVSTLDLVAVSKHILNLEPLDSPWKMIAADINKSNSITTFDIVESRRAILGVYDAFPLLPSWRFLPSGTTFINLQNPFEGGLPMSSITISNLQSAQSNLNFTGVKVGDVNNSSNPGN